MANKSTGVIILALLVGIAGLGLGGYATFLKDPVPGPAGQDGTDGLDAPGYFCYSQAEIIAALTEIGTGDGCITIMTDIVLTSGIVINQSGSYTIQGAAPVITLECNALFGAFVINSVVKCIIRDLTINASLLTSSIANVIYANDANVYMENVQIFGDGDRLGRGILISGSNVWVSNCYLVSLGTGIWSSGDYAHISDNTIVDCSSSGIYIDNGLLTTVTSNLLYQSRYIGINAMGDNCTYSGNIIVGVTYSIAIHRYGMIIGGDYNVVTGNSVTGFINSHGSYSGYGMGINGAINTVVGNMILGNEINFSDLGTGTVEFGNNYT